MTARDLLFQLSVHSSFSEMDQIRKWCVPRRDGEGVEGGGGVNVHYNGQICNNSAGGLRDLYTGLTVRYLWLTPAKLELNTHRCITWMLLCLNSWTSFHILLWFVDIRILLGLIPIWLGFKLRFTFLALLDCVSRANAVARASVVRRPSSVRRP